MTVLTAFQERVPDLHAVCLNSLEEQEAAQQDLTVRMGGLPTNADGSPMLDNYFGMLLPAVFVSGDPLKSEAGELLHFYLQAAIEPPFDMDDEKGITGCATLDARVQQTVERAMAKL
eukprot:TRINITY_DN8933_c0_g1_i1.p2 TRINITY_DN8933_c0_g1~~TRINITY_DN8933_c0_g1_i1.p2  ORF type:complete len:117 (-),score=29.41 TRINITY_DN8933_c0_g1_i1:381-731(-)